MIGIRQQTQKMYIDMGKALNLKVEELFLVSFSFIYELCDLEQIT